MKTKKPTVLLIDDEPLVLEMFAYVLRESGLRVKTALSPEEGLEILAYAKIDALISDVFLEPINGFDVARIARRELPALPVVLITGRPSPEDQRRATQNEMMYLSKPLDVRALVAHVLHSVSGVDHSCELHLQGV
jgi:DNA-binding response OmpR family regulator